ncbi:MAG: hypothetical protein GX851_07570 [Clostridiales bacterium]|nr:hypothetical protein [Clostridiales bacterium]
MKTDTVRYKILLSARDGFSAFALFMPLALSMGICSPFGLWGFMLCGAVLASVYGNGAVRLSPSFYGVFLFMLCMGRIYSSREISTVLFTAGIFMLPLMLAAQKLQNHICMPKSIAAGASLGFAALMTVIMTNDYFGIGAYGITALDMLKSYRSFGFHPNWRGILFGTIVMVIMITFPRKFKKLKDYLPAQFVAMAVTLVLNLLLNPVAANTPMAEAGTFYSPRTPFVLPFFEINSVALPNLLASAAALALLCTGVLFLSDNKSSNLMRGGTIGLLAACSLTSGIPMIVPPQAKSEDDEPSLGNLFFMTLFFLITVRLCNILISRTPVASAAVLLIVGAWQSVDWGKIKRALTCGPLSIILFILSFFAVLVFTVPRAVFVIFVIFVLVCLYNFRGRLYSRL